MGSEVLEVILHEFYRVEEAKDINVVGKVLSRREDCSSLQNRTNLKISRLLLDVKFTREHIRLDTVRNRPTFIPPLYFKNNAYSVLEI